MHWDQFSIVYLIISSKNVCFKKKSIFSGFQLIGVNDLKGTFTSGWTCTCYGVRRRTTATSVFSWRIAGGLRTVPWEQLEIFVRFDGHGGTAANLERGLEVPVRAELHRVVTESSAQREGPPASPVPAELRIPAGTLLVCFLFFKIPLLTPTLTSHRN